MNGTASGWGGSLPGFVLFAYGLSYMDSYFSESVFFRFIHYYAGALFIRRFAADEKWRRRESNPRPRTLQTRSLRA